MWQDWTNTILGLAVMGVAIYGYAVMGATMGWSLIILGAVIAIVGFWGATALSAGTARQA
ncbi:MAG: hypothetical protein KGH79_04050 [Patescibacteria group bacterium]|nr:hypothetical protein [Patescibacteria group bacterium]